MQPVEVRLFTDGACSGNPGPGGWAYILYHLGTGARKSDSGGDPESTNNRMELTAAIRGLEALKRPCSVELVTDSEYVAKGIAQWMPAWKARGWRKSKGAKGGAIKNLELWQRLDELCTRHTVKCTHVFGHQGHAENEECDRMAVAAYQRWL